MAILPFYLALGVDLRSIRVVRLLRLFRLLKITRYSEAIQRLSQAFRTIREELVLFGSVALVLLYVSAVGVYFFERDAQPEQFASKCQLLYRELYGSLGLNEYDALAAFYAILKGKTEYNRKLRFRDNHRHREFLDYLRH